MSDEDTDVEAVLFIELKTALEDIRILLDSVSRVLSVARSDEDRMMAAYMAAKHIEQPEHRIVAITVALLMLAENHEKERKRGRI